MEDTIKASLDTLIKNLSCDPYVHPSQVGYYLLNIARHVREIELHAPEPKRHMQPSAKTPTDYIPR